MPCTSRATYGKWGCQMAETCIHVWKVFQLLYLNSPGCSKHFKSKISKSSFLKSENYYNTKNIFKFVSTLWNTSCIPSLVSLQLTFSFARSCVNLHSGSFCKKLMSLAQLRKTKLIRQLSYCLQDCLLDLPICYWIHSLLQLCHVHVPVNTQKVLEKYKKVNAQIPSWDSVG